MIRDDKKAKFYFCNITTTRNIHVCAEIQGNSFPWKKKISRKTGISMRYQVTVPNLILFSRIPHIAEICKNRPWQDSNLQSLDS